MAISIAFAGTIGVAVGSFFNVVAYRLPRHESLVSPGSRCPRCGSAIKPYDNVPLLGWLLLRGRCRACHEQISARYPIVEALSAVLAVSVVLVKHSTHDIALGLALLAVLIPIALIDLDHRIIPNKITLPAAIAALGIGLATKPSGVPEQLLAGLAAGGFLLVFALVYPQGMGMGDVKLAAVLGLYLGRFVAIGIFAGVLAASLLGFATLARLGIESGRKQGIAFGPFLALGGVVALLAGPTLLHWYLHVS